jgi:hypothetical protein
MTMIEFFIVLAFVLGVTGLIVYHVSISRE